MGVTWPAITGMIVPIPAENIPGTAMNIYALAATLVSLTFALTVQAQSEPGLPETGVEVGTTLLDTETPVPPDGTMADAPEGVGAPADPFDRDSYRLDPTVCPFRGDIDYRPGDFDCFLLEVPENREDPGSRFIELHVVRLNARWGKEEFEDRTEETGLAPGKRDDPVIYLQTEKDCRPNEAPCAALGQDRAVVLGPAKTGLLALTTGIDDAVIIQVEVIMLGAAGVALGRQTLAADAPAWHVGGLPAGTRLLRYRIKGSRETTVAEFPL